MTQWTDYLMVGGALVGARVLHSDSSVTTRYFHTHNLGSITVITDENGAVVERDGYDVWGKRRFCHEHDEHKDSRSGVLAHRISPA